MLGPLLALFILLQAALPLRTAIQLGGDEGFELAKATLCLKGYSLYSQVWNDQPPLHTFLLTELLKHVSRSVYAARLLTTAFALVLLTSVFLLCLRVSGLPVAGIATGLLIASPGFLQLASSCMLEVPSLGMALAGLAGLVMVPANRWYIREAVCGAFLGLALEIKLVPLVLLPVVGLVLLAQSPKGTLIRAAAVVFATLALVFVGTDLLIERGAFLMHFQQSWASHFAPARSFEYGSPNEHTFDWSVLARNWDASIPAVIGALVSLQQARKRLLLLLPAAWLGLSLVVFGTHKPWWSYYYVHTAIPLCWCAALGLVEVCRRLQNRHQNGPNAAQSHLKGTGKREHTRTRPGWAAIGRWLALVSYALAACAWMSLRLDLQVAAVRASPQTYNSLVLEDIARLRPYTQWLYADEQIYSFHAGIPLPPPLAVVMLKRLWSGEMTNERIRQEMWKYKPGLILLSNDMRQTPFQDLIRAEYRMVYQDGAHRLYAHKTVLARARAGPAAALSLPPHFRWTHIGPVPVPLLINTPLQRGELAQLGTPNRFSGLPRVYPRLPDTKSRSSKAPQGNEPALA